MVMAGELCATGIIKLPLRDKALKYNYVTEVYTSPSVYQNKIVDDYDAGYKQRLIITLSEIYTTVYIDKLKLDVEGGITECVWSRRMDMTKLYESFSLSYKTDHIKNIKWTSVNSFAFEISGHKLNAIITENEDFVMISSQ